MKVNGEHRRDRQIATTVFTEVPALACEISSYQDMQETHVAFFCTPVQVVNQLI